MLSDPAPFGDLTSELFLAHPLAEILERSVFVLGHPSGVILEQERLTKQEALQLVPLDFAGVEETRHGCATEEREIATEEYPVEARKGPLELVGMSLDELVHAFIAHQLGIEPAFSARRPGMKPSVSPPHTAHVHHPSSFSSRCPGRHEIANLPGRQLLAGDRVNEALASFPVGARQRDQALHRRVRGDLTAKDSTLNRFRKVAHQGEPPAHPAHASIEAPRDILQRKTETQVQLAQPRPLLARRLLGGGPHQSAEQQRVGFFQVPAGGPDHVAPETPHRPDPLASSSQSVG
jgi:hypothetical protein